MGVDPVEFVSAMTEPVRAAAAAVRWLEGRVSNRPKVDEDTDAKSALTDADCVSQEILLTALHARFPSVAIEAEEDTPAALQFAGVRSDDLVVVDPIDGTLRYVEREGLYAIIVGLERKGRVEASVIAVPQEDVIVRAVRNGGVQISTAGSPFEIAVLGTGGRRLLTSHTLEAEAGARAAELGLESVKAAGGAIGVAPLLDDTLGAVRVSHNALGLSRRAWIAALPTLEAGGRVAALDGPLPPRFCEGVAGQLVAHSEEGLDALRALIVR